MINTVTLPVRNNFLFNKSVVKKNLPLVASGDISNSPIRQNALQSILSDNARKHSTLGFSLIESLVVISIVALISTITLPTLSSLVTSSELNSTERNLRRAIATARSTALSTGNITTLCGGAESACSGEWKKGYLLFVDNNNNGSIDNDEKLLEQVELPSTLSISWRASGRAGHLKFSPSGMARQFGRFHICHHNKNPTASRALVINRQGRVRSYKDRQGNGRFTDINGEEPVCK